MKNGKKCPKCNCRAREQNSVLICNNKKCLHIENKKKVA